MFFIISFIFFVGTKIDKSVILCKFSQFLCRIVKRSISNGKIFFCNNIVVKRTLSVDSHNGKIPFFLYDYLSRSSLLIAPSIFVPFSSCSSVGVEKFIRNEVVFSFSSIRNALPGTRAIL